MIFANIVVPSLTANQYATIYNLFSLVVASMLFTALYLVLARNSVAEAYRDAVLISAMVCGIACYHYFRIFDNFKVSYPAGATADSVHVLSNIKFNEGYRYVDWLLTVPLLLVEIIAVMGLAKAAQKALLTDLVPAAFAMILLGYPGEISTATGPRLIWGLLSTLPFVYIVYVLFVELGKSLADQRKEVRHTVSMLRLMIVGFWGVYPIAYLFPLFGGKFFGGASGFVLRQSAYSIADILAKAGFALIILKVARMKSAEGNTSTAITL